MRQERDDFEIALRDGVVNTARADANASVIVLDAGDDPVQQAEQVKRLAAAHVTVLLVDAVDSAQLGPALSQVHGTGVPIVAVDHRLAGSYAAAFAGSSDLQVGNIAAQQLMDLVPESSRVVMLVGATDPQAARDRSQGFRSAMGDASVNVKRAQLEAELVAGTTRSGGAAAMSKLLQRDSGVAGIFVQSADTALGALDVLRARGLVGKVAVVAVGATPDLLQATRSGEVAAVIVEQPAIIGQRAAELALELAKHQKVPDSQEVPLIVLTPQTS
jgi:ribose transport system substrate-binding protein